MRQNDPTQADFPASVPGGLQICEHCQRYTPFTLAILAGKPLGVICTCALEQRLMQRLVIKLAAQRPHTEGRS